MRRGHLADAKGGDVARQRRIGVHRGPTGQRVLAASIIGALAGGGTAFGSSWVVAELVGWDVACILFLILTWTVIAPKDASDTEAAALAEDPSAPLADLVIISAAVTCIVGAGFALMDAGRSHGGLKGALITLAVASVVASWGAIHTVFTLRYARLYFTEGHAGIDFNEDDPPEYRDFAYIALTIGMTFQVSDTDIGSKAIRRMALRHALISWLFGAVLVGLTINVLGSLLSSGSS